MVIDDNRRRTDLVPRKDIPESWATRGLCPLCANPAMKVVHLPGSCDYLLCARCELSFEVEMSSSLLRLKNIPEQLGFMEDELRHNWVQPGMLKKLLENRASIMQQKAGMLAEQMLPDEEVWNRMLGLYRLGNKPRMIEFMLLQGGASREQVESASLKLQKWSALDERQQGRKLWIVGAVTLLLILALFAAGWGFTSSRINAQLEQGRGLSAGQPNQPLQMLNYLPEVIKPEFLKAPAPYVEKSGPGPARCPVVAREAADLFGGEAEAWQPGSQPYSWQMITTGKPAVIHIPQRMYAGFIDNKTFVFTAADGPATIHNVNFMVISCQ